LAISSSAIDKRQSRIGNRAIGNRFGNQPSRIDRASTIDRGVPDFEMVRFRCSIADSDSQLPMP
jgi:hypothetical protein